MRLMVESREMKWFCFILVGFGLLFRAPHLVQADEPVATAEVPESISVTAEPPSVTREPTSQPTATPAAPAPTVQQVAPSPTVQVVVGGPPPLQPQPTESTTVEVPLSITLRSSVSQATIGSDIDYVIMVSSSRSGAVVSLRFSPPEGTQVVGASVGNGSCSGSGSVDCRVNLGNTGSAAVSVRVRVIALPGSSSAARVIAEDDQRITAADQVNLTFVAPPAVAVEPAPTAASQAPVAVNLAPAAPDAPDDTPQAEAPAAPAVPTAQPVEAAPGRDGRWYVPESVVAVPASAPILDQLSRDADTPAELPVSEATPAEAIPAEVPVVPARPADLAVAPPVAVAAPVAAEQPQRRTLFAAAELPATSATSTLLGIGVGSLGFGLIVLALRRVLGAARLLDQQSLTGPLTPVIRALRRALERG